MGTEQRFGGARQRWFMPRPLVVLAVDDATVRASYAYALTATGFDVTTIDDPAAWADDAANRDPDAIVADTSADSRFGWTFVHALKTGGRTAGIPLVAVADDADEDTRARARRERCAAVCIRTCPPGVLVSGIRAVLDLISSSPQ
jgi:DNA-binding response OmpR family regulator